MKGFEMSSKVRMQFLINVPKGKLATLSLTAAL